MLTRRLYRRLHTTFIVTLHQEMLIEGEGYQEERYPGKASIGAFSIRACALTTHCRVYRDSSLGRRSASGLFIPIVFEYRTKGGEVVISTCRKEIHRGVC